MLGSSSKRSTWVAKSRMTDNASDQGQLDPRDAQAVVDAGELRGYECRWAMWKSQVAGGGLARETRP